MTAESPILWVLAGGNGAGKSTFYRQFLKPKGIPFVNADIIAKEIAPDATDIASYNAAILAEHQRTGAVERHETFCYETVFSHDSKLDFLAAAMGAGYKINLVIIYLLSADINRARVAQRVAEGGHPVPEDKINERIPRTHQNMSMAAHLCDEVFVFDNSRADDPFQLVMRITHGSATLYSDDAPDWVQDIFRSYNES